ncbi:MAG: alpha/beta fold hydrolase [Acidimicrobiales bacterium]
MTEHPATAADEYPVYVRAPTGDLLAVVTQPTAPSNGMALVMLRGGGWRPSSGPRRTQVRTARQLAGLGFHGVRFSYHGVAESGGEGDDVVRLDRPYVDDTRAVVGWVQERGLRPILVGNCFGARTALAYAAADGGVAGLVLLVPPVHDFEVSRRLDRRPLSHFARRASPAHMWRVLRNRARRQALGRTGRAFLELAGRRVRAGDDATPEWLSRRFVGQLETIVGERVPVLFVYGDEDSYRRDFETARATVLGPLFDDAGPRVRVETVGGKVHGLTSVATQDAVLAAVERWAGQALPAVADVDGRS